MNSVTSSKRLKYSAKRHLSGHYNAAVSATVTVQLISSAASLLTASFGDRSTAYGAVIFYAIQFLLLLLTALFSSGQCYFFLNMCCGRPVTTGMIFYGWTYQPEKAILVQFYQILTYVICSAPGILFIILAEVTQDAMYLTSAKLLLIAAAVLVVYWGIAFSQSFYLLHDFPNSSARELIGMSCRMMKGQKLRYLALLISFIPLYLVAILTFGIGLLWVLPYVNTAMTEFFLDLMNHRESLPPA